MAKAEEHWVIGKELSRGGQGKVFCVTRSNGGDENQEFRDIKFLLRQLAGGHIENTDIKNLHRLKDFISKASRIGSDQPDGALKVLLDEREAKNFKTAIGRIQSEIKALQELQHPNLIEMLDHDGDNYSWYVSKFYKRGSLEHNISYWSGDVLRALLAFRGLVMGVDKIHSRKMVHRDIKPGNIFLGDNEELILGDFGLVLKPDAERLTQSGEKVGTTFWMPLWAHPSSEEPDDETFDVFALGKILWALIGGLKSPPYWHFNEGDSNDLQKLFPQNRAIPLVKEFLSKCVVERKERCLPNAGEMLVELEALISKIRKHSRNMLKNDLGPCLFCTNGTYTLISNKDEDGTRELGVTPNAAYSFKIFLCDKCGHVQRFAFPRGGAYPEWRK